jgi:hypothetical protein
MGQFIDAGIPVLFFILKTLRAEFVRLRVFIFVVKNAPDGHISALIQSRS